MPNSRNRIPVIVGEAPAIQELNRIIDRLSQSAVTALIKGASGTGKSLAARALHAGSARANQAFISLNLAVIQQQRIEAESGSFGKSPF